MPTYVLEGLGEVRVRDHALNLGVRIDGNEDDVLLVAMEDGRELDTVIRRPNMLIVPRITGPTMVSVVPSRGTRFPGGSTVHLTVTVEDRGADDPERAVLEPIDVSGLERRDLVAIERIDGSLVLRAARNHQDEDLGPLANAARIAAREVMGVQWVDEASARDMTIALDASGSMVEAVRDGSVGALVKVLTGISQVVSRGRDVRGALLGSTASIVEAAGLGRLPEQLETAHRDRIPEGRFLASAPGLTTPGRQSLAFLLTASVPADLAGVPGVDPASTRHVVALMDPEVWELLATGPGASIPHTVVQGPESGTGLERQLLGDPAALRALVCSLLERKTATDTVAERTRA